MTPTSGELADIKAHTMHETFTGWSPDQRAAYLAVLRGNTRTPAVAASLGWSVDRTVAVLESMHGHLLWDRSRDDARINLRD